MKRRDIIDLLSANLDAETKRFEGHFRSVGEYKPLESGDRLRRRDRRKTHAPFGQRFVRIAINSATPREDLVGRWFASAKRRLRELPKAPQVLFWKERPRVIYCEKTFTWSCVGKLAVV